MKKIVLLTILGFISIVSIAQHKKNNPKATVEVDVPYTVAKNYFVNNTYKQAHFPKAKISTQKEFDSIFGAAVYMGEEGKASSIDFKKQYVIAVIEKETNHNTTISPVSLKSSKNKLVFTSKMDVENEVQSAMIRPCLIIIVDKKYKGKVVVNNSSVSALPAN